jgi:hypothetical protein
MAAAHVQYLGGAENNTASQTTTVLSPVSKTVTLGNTIVVGWAAYSAITPTGVTDNLGNTYSHIELKHVSYGTADLWYAPVTHAGAIATITVAHASTIHVGISAAEFSGVAASPAAGGGLEAQSATATWVNNKNIPANGLAVGNVIFNGGPVTQSAGAASGSPSTTIVQSGQCLASGQSSSIFYALAGSSAVTSFAGTVTLASSSYWDAVGGIFNPAAAAAGAKPNFIPFFWA